jgi:hypothetical protein
MCSGAEPILQASLEQWQFNSRGDVLLAMYLCSGADASFNSWYAAYTCGTKPRHIFFGFR